MLCSFLTRARVKGTATPTTIFAIHPNGAVLTASATSKHHLNATGANYTAYSGGLYDVNSTQCWASARTSPDEVSWFPSATLLGSPCADLKTAWWYRTSNTSTGGGVKSPRYGVLSSGLLGWLFTHVHNQTGVLYGVEIELLALSTMIRLNAA